MKKNLHFLLVTEKSVHLAMLATTPMPQTMAAIDECHQRLPLEVGYQFGLGFISLYQLLFLVQI